MDQRSWAPLPRCALRRPQAVGHGSRGMPGRAARLHPGEEHPRQVAFAMKGRSKPRRSSKLKLTFACWNYDRTRALADGRVRPDGIELNYLDLPVEETFFRMLRHREFDVAELSLSSYVVSLFRKPQPFIAIPIFPSRVFRHSSIYVNAAAGIRTPKDLVGKRVGDPE